MTEKAKILKQLDDAKKAGGYTLNITLPAAADFIRKSGKYDFFINDFTGEKKSVIYKPL